MEKVSTDDDRLAEVREGMNRLKAEEVERPKMPVHKLVQEARDLYTWCADDREALERAGLDWTLVTSLPARADAAGWAQARWNQYREGQKIGSEKAADCRKRAKAAFSELKHAMRFAYHKDASLLRAVKMATDRTDAALIQSLCDLAVLGQLNFDPLRKIGVDSKALERAASLCEEFSHRAAEATVERRGGGNAIKADRNRAYTFLKQAVDTIRRHGRFAFSKNPKRAKGYASAYNRKDRRDISE